MQQQGPPSDNLFVGELPEGIQDATVRQLFAQYGTVTDLRVLPGNAVGTSAALIRFAHEEEATWIVNNVNGNIPEGLSSPVSVRYANSRGSGKGGGKGGAGPQQQAVAAAAPQGFSNGGCAVASTPSANGAYAAIQYHPDDVRYNPYGAQQAAAPGWNAGAQQAAAPGWNASPAAAWGGDGGWSEKGWSKGWDDKGKGKGKGKKGAKELIFRFGSDGILPGGGKWTNDENTLFVGGLPYDTTDTDLYCLFSPFGAIAPRGIKAMVDRNTSECTGVGFVNFLDAMAAQTAVQTLDGQLTPTGHPLRVSIKISKKDQGWGDSWDQQQSGAAAGGGQEDPNQQPAGDASAAAA